MCHILLNDPRFFTLLLHIDRDLAAKALCDRVTTPAVRNSRNVYDASRGQMIIIARATRCRGTRAAIPIAFYSGMRVSEMIRAQVRNDMFVLQDSKNDDPRIVPIHPKIHTAVGKKLSDHYAISKRFKAAARSVGLGDMRFHGLQHSAASAMINEGVDLYTGGAVLGHRPHASTSRYAHLATNSLRIALLRISKKSPTAKTKRVA